METLTTKPTLRATDRLTQTVAALARLLDQTMNDIQAADAEFQDQIHDLAADRDRQRLEMEQLQDAATEWESERTRLLADFDRSNILLEQAKSDHDRALAETDEAASIALEMQIATAVERVRAELTAKWNAERESLIAERDRAQQRLADAVPAPADSAAIDAEVARVEEMIHAISHVVENPDTELSIVIRKNVERAELESYLRGLRFKR
jgi:chromosome segregation ATPase